MRWWYHTMPPLLARQAHGQAAWLHACTAGLAGMHAVSQLPPGALLSSQSLVGNYHKKKPCAQAAPPSLPLAGTVALASHAAWAACCHSIHTAALSTHLFAVQKVDAGGKGAVDLLLGNAVVWGAAGARAAGGRRRGIIDAMRASQPSQRGTAPAAPPPLLARWPIRSFPGDLAHP